MEKPAVMALSRFDWDLFVTLTFVRETMPMVLRRKYWFEFARTLAGNYSVHFRRLLWMLRTERGEQGGRFHYHALVGGLPHHARHERTCLVLMSQWEHQRPLVQRRAPDGTLRMLSRFCGMARVRVFDPGMDGLDYFVEETTEGGSRIYTLMGANKYETEKFGEADTVEISESCLYVMKTRVRYERDRDRRSGDSAVTIQCRQREVGFSCSQAASDARSTPVLPSTTLAITERTAINQVTVEPAQTGHKITWQDKGGGVFAAVWE